MRLFVKDLATVLLVVALVAAIATAGAAQGQRTAWRHARLAGLAGDCAILESGGEWFQVCGAVPMERPQ